MIEILNTTLQVTGTKQKLNYASMVIAQRSLGDDYDDTTYNYTYLYDMKIGLDFHFFL